MFQGLSVKLTIFQERTFEPGSSASIAGQSGWLKSKGAGSVVHADALIIERMNAGLGSGFL